MTEYTKASQAVINIAKDLINRYHRELGAADIGFIFRDEATTSKGKTVFAKAWKPPAWLQAYKTLDFIIEIAEDIWNDLDTDRRIALIDHELCHCDNLGDTPSLRAHDVEEFTEIIERHGFWNRDLMSAAPRIRGAVQLAEKKGSVTKIDPEDLKQPEVIST